MNVVCYERVCYELVCYVLQVCFEQTPKEICVKLLWKYLKYCNWKALPENIQVFQMTTDEAYI